MDTRVATFLQIDRLGAVDSSGIPLQTSRERRVTVGDKGGKKDKDKSRKQKQSKDDQEKKRKLDKKPKKTQ